MRRETGFTMIEMLVAITMTIIIAGSAMYMFTMLERHRRVQERRARHAGEAQAFFSMLEREISAMYRYGGANGYKTFEATVPGGGVIGSRLTFTTAVEPLPGADHAQVTYYVDAAGLHREIMSPGYSAPQGGSTVFAPDVRRLDVVTDPNPVPANTLPKRLLVTITLPHHDQWQEAMMNVTWSHFFKVENDAP